MENREYEKVINRVGITTIIWNVILAIAKFIAGIIGKSTAMVSDAVHSGSDVFTTIIVMIGAKISSKEKDEQHPYGHERFESIASIFLGVLLAITALGIGYEGLKAIINFKSEEYVTSSLIYLPLISAIVSIVVKGVMFIYTMKAAKKINSSSLKADSYHHLSDSLSSIGSLIGIIGLMIGKGLQILDPIAAIIICLVILKVAYDIIKGAIDQLVDHSISKEIEAKIETKIKEYDGIISIKSFMSRQFGNKMYLDIEVYVDSQLSLKEANDIVIGLHDELEGEFCDIKHCSISPYPKTSA